MNFGGMIKQVNKDVQDNYTIQGPPIVKLPKSTDLSKKKENIHHKYQDYKKEFKLKDTDGVDKLPSNGGNNGLIKIHHHHLITKPKWG